MRKILSFLISVAIMITYVPTVICAGNFAFGTTDSLGGSEFTIDKTQSIVNFQIVGNVKMGESITASYTIITPEGGIQDVTGAKMAFHISPKADFNAGGSVKEVKNISSLALNTSVASNIAVGQFIRARVGNYASNIVEITEPKDTPVAKLPTVIAKSGGANIGDTLSLAYSYTGVNNEGASTYQWVRRDIPKNPADKPAFQDISGATQKDYIVSENDKNKEIYCKITPIDLNGNGGTAVLSTNCAVGGNLGFGRQVTMSKLSERMNNDASKGGALDWRFSPMWCSDGLRVEYSFFSGNFDKVMYVDLMNSQFVNTINIVGGGQNYYVWLSDNGENWTPLFENVTSTATGLLVEKPAVYGRYLAFRMVNPNNSGNSVRLSEVEVFFNEKPPTVTDVAVQSQLVTRVGDMVHCNYTFHSETAMEGDTTFKWFKSDALDGKYSIIENEQSRDYTVSQADLGGYIKCEVTPVAQSGQYAKGEPVMSTAVGPVKNAVSLIPTAPVCETVTASGLPYENEVLTGAYKYYDDNGDDEDVGATITQWYREKVGSNVKETVNSSVYKYSVTSADIGYNIYYGVTPKATVEPYFATQIYYSQPITIVTETAVLDANSIDIPGDLQNVTTTLLLPVSGKLGSKISWTSSDETVVRTDGIVFRGSTDKTATLTATTNNVNRPNISGKRIFDVTVKKATTGGGSSGGGGGGSSSGGGGGSSSGGGGSNPEYVAPLVPKPTIPENPDITPEYKEYGDKNSISEWAVEAVTELTKKGVLKGGNDNLFKPQDYITRGELVTMIVKAFDLKSEVKTADFADVFPGDWYYADLMTAKSLGIIKGFEDGNFRPNDSISREDMAVMIYGAMKLKNPEIVGKQPTFSDKNRISSYATYAVGLLQEKSLISGVGNNCFAPQDKTTREQGAKIMYMTILAN